MKDEMKARKWFEKKKHERKYGDYNKKKTTKKYKGKILNFIKDDGV